MKKLLFLLLISSFRLYAQTNLYVDSSVNASGMGTSWPTAYKTLGEALSTANANRTTKYIINIAKGTYFPTGTQAGTNRNTSFLVSRGGIKMYGGFPSGGGSRDINGNPVILNGNIGNTNTNTDNSNTVMTVNDTTAIDSVTIDGLTFANANSGTGLFVQLGSPRSDQVTVACIIESCAFLNNKSSGYGGGIGTGTTTVINNSIFSGNTAASGGGAIFASVSFGLPAFSRKLIISGTTFTNNQSQSGGVIFNIFNFIISNSTFTGNSAYQGGIVYHYDGLGRDSLIQCSFNNNNAFEGGVIYNPVYLSIINCSMKSNHAKMGGGICCDQWFSYVYAFNTEFINNTADSIGGAICNSEGMGSIFISKSAILNNMAAKGGGLYLSNSTIHPDWMSYEIIDSKIEGNVADTGAGIYTMNGAVDLFNCLLAGNLANKAGGAMYNCHAPANISNCTFAGDSAFVGPGIYNDSLSAPVIAYSIIWEGSNSIYNVNNSNPTIQHCIINGAYVGTANINTDPMFVNPIPSSFAPDTVGNYSLLPCSPAINVGTAPIPNNPMVNHDIIGNPRLDTATDLGAYEFQGIPQISGNDSVCTGASTQFSNTFTGGKWKSSDTNIAVVDSTTGIVTGMTAGTAIVTYTLCNNIVAKNITVKTAPPQITITGDSIICIDGALSLSSSSNSGAWYNGNTAIAIIDSQGNISPVLPGVDTIKYIISGIDGCSSVATKVISVEPLPDISPITGHSVVCMQDTLSLSNAQDGGVWLSLSPAVATIDTAGIVTGLSNGIDTITYTITNAAGCEAAVGKLITVNTPVVDSITYAPGANCYDSLNEVLILSETTLGGIWSSSNANIAAIDNNGVITINAPGNASFIYRVINNIGCSAAQTVTLTFNVKFTGSIYDTICSGDHYSFAGQQLTTSGTYTHTFQSISGCDSIITLHLHVNTIDTTITQNNSTLSNSQQGASYQWINCATHAIISGQTSQTFTATTSGIYAAIITVNGCSDTSSCYNVFATGVNGITANEIGIFPNPTSGQVTIKTTAKAAYIIVKDITGRVMQQFAPTGKVCSIDLDSYTSGTYLVDVIFDGGIRYTQRISLVK